MSERVDGEMFTDCPDCNRRVASNFLEAHQLEECPGEREPCSICGNYYEDYTDHIHRRCSGPEG
jgi:hypothetical protein